MPSQNIDRRQLLKSTLAGAAAIGTGVVAVQTGKACPLTYDKDGNLVDWWCIISILQKGPLLWLYEWENCRTGQTANVADVPGLSTGDCSNAANEGASCVQGLIFDQYNRERINGKEFRISPSLAHVDRAKVRQLLGG